MLVVVVIVLACGCFKAEVPADRHRPDRLFDLLTFTTSTLTAAKVPFCVIYGTLLGAVRGGRIISWDKDVDLLILQPDWNAAIQALRAAELPSGVKIRIHNTCIVRVLNARGEHCELYRHERVGDNLEIGKEMRGLPHGRPEFLSLPAKLVLPFKPAGATLSGLSVPTPANPTALLELMYGKDWQAPCKRKPGRRCDFRDKL